MGNNMTPHKSGWLKEYLELRRDLLWDLTSERTHKQSHPEYTLYRVIQPTGLMYGQSIGEVGTLEVDKWNEKDRLKILLAESLISSALLFHDKPVTTTEDLSKVFMKTLDSISHFYTNIFPELSIATKTIFGRKKSTMEIVEKILEKRIESTHQTKSTDFWSHFFNNTLLFLDIFIYGQWIHTNADKIVADFFRYERDELRFSVIKIIAAAAHANRQIAPEEKKLFEYFLESTQMEGERKNEALKIFADGIAVEDINLPSENSWILKKFFLEIAILTLWADQKVEPAELNFLKQFSHYIGFADDDLENSIMAIEAFVLEHWNHLEHLQSKEEVHQVSDLFVKRVSRVAERNKSTLIKEMQANEDVMNLLRKASANELDLHEKERMRIQLIDMLNKVPTLTLIALPQRYLTLPLLLKILPRNIFAEGIMKTKDQAS